MKSLLYRSQAAVSKISRQDTSFCLAPDQARVCYARWNIFYFCQTKQCVSHKGWTLRNTHGLCTFSHLGLTNAMQTRQQLKLRGLLHLTRSCNPGLLFELRSRRGICDVASGQRKGRDSQHYAVWSHQLYNSVCSATVFVLVQTKTDYAYTATHVGRNVQINYFCDILFAQSIIPSLSLRKQPLFLYEKITRNFLVLSNVQLLRIC